MREDGCGAVRQAGRAGLASMAGQRGAIWTWQSRQKSMLAGGGGRQARPKS